MLSILTPIGLDRDERADGVLAARARATRPITTTSHISTKQVNAGDASQPFDGVIGLVDMTYRRFGGTRPGMTFPPNSDSSIKSTSWMNIWHPRVRALGGSNRTKHC